MSRVVFLLEEPSMKDLLDALLPRLFPTLVFFCIPHQGKSDLERSIPRKLRGWRTPSDYFVVVRDNDNGDCYALKERLRQLCQASGKGGALVRIVCQELEAWYLGDPGAMADAFDDEKLRSIGRRALYRNPDARPKPSEDVKRLVPGFQKTNGVRRMAERMTREGNSSHSFAVFLNGVERLLASDG